MAKGSSRFFIAGERVGRGISEHDATVDVQA
jgi:hypothetical protein